MRITEALLREHEACEDQVALFSTTFPGGVQFPVAEPEKVAKTVALAGLDTDWAAGRLLPALALAAYEEAVVLAWRVYREALAPALAAYEEATASARVAYEKDEAWAAYKEVKTPAWAAYEEATALAFIRALNGQSQIVTVRCRSLRRPIRRRLSR